ncbi:hypothetical protein VTK56DRAFT_7477 [Thermocarpiscus australiensis]
MSNTTDSAANTSSPSPSPSTPAPPTTSTNSPPPATSTQAPPPPSTTQTSAPKPSTTPPTTSSSAPPPPPSTSSTPPTTPSSSSSAAVPPTSTSTPDVPTTSTVIQTVTQPLPPTVSSNGSQAPTATTTSAAPPAISPTDTARHGLGNSGKIAVAVVVPIAAVALLVLAGIFFWRKRKQRKDAEEQRRKEVEDYGYNPNADPTIPAVAAAGYEMGEDGPSGYRGWGSTAAAGSTGRKASTTMSGGAGAYSDAASPTRPAVSDRSGEPLMGEVPPSPQGEILGAMGPSAANNRADVHRGPSNASSSYSAANRSDGSGDGPIGVAYGGGNPYYDQYGSGNPYVDNGYSGHPVEAAGQPVIRDVTARRNTRIENPAHYPQQSAGISQNF